MQDARDTDISAETGIVSEQCRSFLTAVEITEERKNRMKTTLLLPATLNLNFCVRKIGKTSTRWDFLVFYLLTA